MEDTENNYNQSHEKLDLESSPDNQFSQQNQQDSKSQFNQSYISQKINDNSLNKQEKNEKNDRLDKQQNFLCGLPNYHLSCYINSGLQLLRQIDYSNQTIFSGFPLLNELFRQMRGKGIRENDIYLKKILQEYHNNNPDDSYVFLLKILNNFKKSLIDKKLFQENFQISSIEIIQCSKCKKQEQLPQHEVGIQIISLKSFFQKRNYQKSEELLCYNCRLYKKHSIITKYIKFPKFIIARLQEQQFQQIDLDKIYDLESDENTFVRYKVIGFCNYVNRYHYSYTAKYDQNWYTFDDSKCSTPQNLNTKYALYYLLIKE